MRIFLLLLLISSLLVLLVLLNTKTIFKLLSRAAPVPANIVVDASQTAGFLNRPWLGLAQGGEVGPDGQLVTLNRVADTVSQLQPRYLRLDHVFDFPSEERLNEIVQLGAVPIISLSYFPAGTATSDVGTVTNWNQWQTAVTALVERVSGQNGLNLTGVYYEVWNEPDGPTFGNFQVGRGKDYFLLYQKTVEAAQKAQNVNPFKIGGPALADLTRCANNLLGFCRQYWLAQFLALVTKNNARLDFVSWHRYSRKPDEFKKDFEFLDKLTGQFPFLGNREKLVTEWGSDPARNPIHGSVFDAAHLVAVTRLLTDKIQIATKFEIIDGPGDKSDGWGVLSFSGQKKPAFYALELLNRLRPIRLVTAGEGSYVSALATRDRNGVSLVLVNYDPTGRNVEKVPLTITNLSPGGYRLTKRIINSAFPTGRDSTEAVNITSPGVFTTSEMTLPNSIVLLELDQTP